MTTPSSLDAFDFPGLKFWLESALHGQVSLPRLSPDEFPYIAILRMEADLQRSTRRDLERACAELVVEFTVSPRGQNHEFIDSLLRLAVGLRLTELAIPLRDLAHQVGLLTMTRRLVLSALIDLRVPQPADFWDRIFEFARSGPQEEASILLAVTAFAGLLDSGHDQAIVRLPKLPDHPRVGDSVANALDALQATLPEADRVKLLKAINDSLVNCPTAIRSALAEWLQAFTPQAASSRDYSKLDAVLARVRPSYHPVPDRARRLRAA